MQQLSLSGVPLHIWWSLRDRIVVDQDRESGRLYRAILRASPEAPVTKCLGRWAHSREMHALARLPLALVNLNLIKLDEPSRAASSPSAGRPRSGYVVVPDAKSHEAISS